MESVFGRILSFSCGERIMKDTFFFGSHFSKEIEFSELLQLLEVLYIRMSCLCLCFLKSCHCLCILKSAITVLSVQFQAFNIATN